MSVCRCVFMRVRGLVVFAAVLVLLGGTVGGGVGGAAEGSEGARKGGTARRTPVVEVFERCRDAVVNISSTEVMTVRSYSGFERLFEDFFDMPARPRERQYTRHSVGSGFVIHPEGYIVTNAHVVRGTTERKVMFADGAEYDADLIALDSTCDLAVLKVDARGSLPTLPLGRSNDLMIGETVVAIGNALGYAHTVTAGVVSAVNRDVHVAANLTMHDLVQTDASINPGNSGGPLLNVLGELIGVNTALRVDAENIGFAIPVDRLRQVLPGLLDVERRQRVVSGLVVDNLRQPRVLAVEPGSPAEKAGIRVGDMLSAVEERPVQEGVDFHISLIGHEPGDSIALRLERGEETIETALRLKERPAPDGALLADEKLGLEVYPLPEDIAQQLGLRRAVGLLVVDLERGGPADVLGIERRDILLSLGGHSVHSLEDLGQLLEVVDGGQELEVTILRVERRGKLKLSGMIRAR